MLLPSVLPCENAFRVSRSRNNTRSQVQAQKNVSKDVGGLIGLGLSLIPTTPSSDSKHPSRIAFSCEALQTIMSMERTPPKTRAASARKAAIETAPSTPSPTYPTPRSPLEQSTPWTTPGCSRESTPTPATYQYTIVTRNNKRRRNGDAVHADAYVTPNETVTPSRPPPVKHMYEDRMTGIVSDEEDDELLNDPFITPKRSRIRGPNSKRMSATPRQLGPWSTDEDKQLVEMVFQKLKLSGRDWAECANTLGRDGMSVGDRWRMLVESGDVGLIRAAQKQEKKRDGLTGSGRGRLEPSRRGRMTRQLRGGRSDRR